jgi:hypothetical protein
MNVMCGIDPVNLTPFQGGRLGDANPGLKPWAESIVPSGHLAVWGDTNPGLNPGSPSNLPRSGLRPSPHSLRESVAGGTQPGVLTPGTHPTRRVALVRRYSGVPTVKNTRAAGLDLLKGRKVKYVLTSEYGLVRRTTRSSVTDFGSRQRHHSP